MDELAQVRSTFGKYHPQAVIIEVGEMDQLSELHRLIWEEE
jgi:putative lipoic acid-binding regulatory protein